MKWKLAASILLLNHVSESSAAVQMTMSSNYMDSLAPAGSTGAFKSAKPLKNNARGNSYTDNLSSATPPQVSSYAPPGQETAAATPASYLDNIAPAHPAAASGVSYMDSIAPVGSTGQFKSAKPLKKDATSGNSYMQALNKVNSLNFSSMAASTPASSAPPVTQSSPIQAASAASAANGVSYMDSIAPPGSTGQYKSAKPLKKTSTSGPAYTNSLSSAAASFSNVAPVSTAATVATTVAASGVSYMDTIAPPGSTGQYKSAKPLKKDSTGGTAYVQSLTSGASASYSAAPIAPFAPAATASVAAATQANTPSFSAPAVASFGVSYIDSIAPIGATGQYKSAKPLKKDSTGGTAYVQSLSSGASVSFSSASPVSAVAASVAAAATGPGLSYMDAIAPAGTSGQYKSAKPIKKAGATSGYMSNLSGASLDFSGIAAAPQAQAPPAQTYTPPAQTYTPPAAAAPAAGAAASSASYMDAIAPAGTSAQYKSAKPIKKAGATSGYMSNLSGASLDFSGIAAAPQAQAPPAQTYTPPAQTYTPPAAAAPAAGAAASSASYMDAIAPAGTSAQYKSAKPIKKAGATSGYMSNLSGASLDFSGIAAAPQAQAPPAQTYTPPAAAVPAATAASSASYLDAIAPLGTTGQFKSAKPIKKAGTTSGYMDALNKPSTTDFSSMAASASQTQAPPATAAPVTKPEPAKAIATPIPEATPEKSKEREESPVAGLLAKVESNDDAMAAIGVAVIGIVGALGYAAWEMMKHK